MIGRAAGNLDQALPGLECHGGHHAQRGWEILGECVDREPQDQKPFIHPTLRTSEKMRRVTG